MSPTASPVSANSSTAAVRTCTPPATRATSAETITTKNTAVTKRVPATARGNIMNVRARVAGFKDGAASVNASDGPRRWLRR